MYWLLGCKSNPSINNKLLIYKAILKPIWTYGIQFWGRTSNSNIKILEHFQSKVLRLIVNAHWYVPNSIICKDLRIPTVKEEISRFSSHYDVRISVHPNELIASLTEPRKPLSNRGALLSTHLQDILNPSHHLLNVLLQIANKLGL
jgi:hypothetical protein